MLHCHRRPLLALLRQGQSFSSATSSSSQANALRFDLQSMVASAGAAKRPLMDVYEELVQQGALREDPKQRRVAKRLDKLSRLLQTYTPPIGYPAPAPAPASPPMPAAGEPSSTPSSSSSSSAPSSSPSSAPPQRKVLRGLYLHGQVGTGKSLLMDLFFHHCPLSRKRRVHFHAFMLEVHARIHAWKQRALREEGRQRHVDLRPERNAIIQIAKEIGQEATVLCFDEFQVTDVADAIIMSSLFGELWSGSGVVVIATSNRAPSELYLDGLNRPYFLPFIDFLSRQCVVEGMDSERDHRQGFAKLKGRYFWPGQKEEEEGGREEEGGGREVVQVEETFKGRRRAAKALDKAFLKLTGGKRGKATEIPVMMGRKLQVPEAWESEEDGKGKIQICRFEFEDLCATDVFAADYAAITERFQTVVLEGVPLMSAEKHNEARRFITLVDVLYERRMQLLMSAEGPVGGLFRKKVGEGEQGREEGGEEEVRYSTSVNVGSLAGETRVIDSAGGRRGGEGGRGEEKDAPAGGKGAFSDPDPLLRQYVDAAQELVVPEGELASVKELAFAFKRAASRLTEMASEEYLRVEGGRAK